MTQPQQSAGSPSRFCSNCGTSLSPQAGFCASCGTAVSSVGAPGGPPLQPGPRTPEPPPQQVPRPSGTATHVPNYLVQAILVTIFCCLPFGIVSIVFPAQVNGKLGASDYAGAMETSKKAKKWAWISFWLGLGITILWVFIGIIVPLAAA